MCVFFLFRFVFYFEFSGLALTGTSGKFVFFVCF